MSPSTTPTRVLSATTKYPRRTRNATGSSVSNLPNGHKQSHNEHLEANNSRTVALRSIRKTPRADATLLRRARSKSKDAHLKKSCGFLSYTGFGARLEDLSGILDRDPGSNELCRSKNVIKSGLWTTEWPWLSIVFVGETVAFLHREGTIEIAHGSLSEVQRCLKRGKKRWRARKR